MKPKHPAAGRGHKALAREQRTNANCNIQGRHALDSVSRVLLLGAFAHYMVGTLPPGLPPSRSFELSVNIHDIETADANTIKAAIAIAPILPSVTEKKVARGRRRTARRREGERETPPPASKNNLEGTASAPEMIMHAVMNGLGRPADRGGGGETGSSQGRSFRRL